jgi:hypothetical protein
MVDAPRVAGGRFPEVKEEGRRFFGPGDMKEIGYPSPSARAPYANGIGYLSSSVSAPSADGLGHPSASAHAPNRQPSVHAPMTQHPLQRET